VTRPRAADDFATIRARMEELRREREGAQVTEGELQQNPPLHRARSLRWPQRLAEGRDGSANPVQAAARSGAGLHFREPGANPR
jgi:hypothetical protein